MAALVLLAAPLLPGRARAQGDGPHTYLPAPVGTNILVPTYMALSSNFNFAQSILLEGADIQSNISVLSYLRFFSLGGRLAQLWVTPVFGTVDGTATVGGQFIDAPKQSGFADPIVNVRIGLVNAPALKPADFMKHQQKFQVYALVGASLPLGEYDSSFPVNLGTNRWAIRLGAPMVAPFGNPARPVWLEVTPSVVFYTDNTDPTGDATLRSQAPLWLVESHLSHNLTKKFWGSLDLRGQLGGETTTDGVPDDNNTRALAGGATLGYQFTRPLGLQVGYGTIFATAGAAEATMWRFRLTYSF
jgi:hypothetical protein